MAEANERKVVLLAEDDIDQAYLARRMLERKGFVVVTAVDGEQALALAEVLNPSAIVLDLVMPGIDGFEFLKVMRDRPGPKPPVIAVSAFRGYLPKAKHLGADEAVRKPYSQKLVDRLAALMDGGIGDGACLSEAEEEPKVGEDREGEEDRRSAAAEEILHLVGGLGRAPDPMLQDLTERTSRIFDVRGCLISLVTRDKDAWIAGTGVAGAPGRSVPRDVSVFAHAIATRAALVVHDAEENPFFRDSEARKMGLRFYAGVPLTSRTGEPLGSLCLMDHRPRDFSWMDLELLGTIARAVVGTIEWREKEAHPREPVSSFRHLDIVDPELMILGRDGFDEVLRQLSDRAADYPDDPEDGATVLVAQMMEERLVPVVDVLRVIFPVAMIGRLGRNRVGVVVVGTASEAARRLAMGAIGGDALVLVRDASVGSQQAVEALRAVEASLDGAQEGRLPPPDPSPPIPPAP